MTQATIELPIRLSHMPTFQLCIISVFAFFGLITAQAQPVLTAANYTVQPGEQYNYLDCADFLPSWNYASEMCWSPSISPWASPATAPGSANFPDATVVMQEPGSPAAQYFTGTPTDFIYNGYFVLPSEMEFCADPMLLLQYPFTLGSTFTDTFHCERTGGVLNSIRQGTITVTGEAYGTLILPWGTFPDCLRVLEVRDLQEIFQNDTAEILRTSYFYILPGIHRPLVIAATQTYSIGGDSIVSDGTSVMEELTTFVEDRTTSDGSFLFPNPASDKVVITCGDRGGRSQRAHSSSREPKTEHGAF
jgi:hypothetical protein